MKRFFVKVVESALVTVQESNVSLVTVKVVGFPVRATMIAAALDGAVLAQRVKEQPVMLREASTLR